MKQKLTLSVNGKLVREARARKLNISEFLEQHLRSHLEGNGSQQPQQTTPQPEQPNQTMKQTNLIELFPSEAVKKLQKHGFDLTDGDWLKRIIYDSLEKCIVQLGFEVYDKRADTYVLLE